MKGTGDGTWLCFGVLGLAAVVRGVFGAGSGVRGEWSAAGGVWVVNFRGFLLAWAGFSFWGGGGAGHWAIILWGLDTFLIFPNSLRF